MQRRHVNLNPPQILALGFLILIITGTVLLILPLSTSSGQGTPLINALFTAASAVCVTGLTVVDTGSYFSLFGQSIILLLIEIGGLGFMTMSVLFALALGKRIMLKERLIMQEALNQINIKGIVRLTKFLVGFTFIVETIAALIIGLHWTSELGAGKAFYYGMFHAISAYCNAGFGLFPDNLAGFTGDVTINLVISALVIIGGIGITVIVDLLNSISYRKNKLSLHSKMVLSITAVLLLVGTAAIFIFEYHNPSSLAKLPLPTKLLSSYFQSVAARTAGFNTLPIGELNQVTLFIIIIFMFIGASPGSTGGGIKTTTFATILLLVRSIIKGKNEVEAFHRTIPQGTILKALTIFIVSLSVIAIGSIILLVTEPFTLMEILFEEVSAFATVGFSTGITPDLSQTGKLVIIITMYLGRIGPLTLAFALLKRMRKESKLRYPEERITVG